MTCCSIRSCPMNVQKWKQGQWVARQHVVQFVFSGERSFSS